MFCNRFRYAVFAYVISLQTFLKEFVDLIELSCFKFMLPNNNVIGFSYNPVQFVYNSFLNS